MMPMSDGRQSLKKIAFQVGDKFFRFAINPENYTDRRPHRTTAVKTKSRIVIEDFQSDVPVISIRGTTGFNPTGKNQDRGFNKIKQMKRYLEEYAEAGGNGNTSVEDFYFHNFTNDESFVVHLSPEGVTFTQDVNSPLTYRYEITFTVLRKAGEPSEDDIVDPEIGNRFPSIPTGPGGPSGPYPIHPTATGSVSSSYNSPSSGGVGGVGVGGSVYNQTTNTSRQGINAKPVNPQAPSSMSYSYGTTALGHTIGYYGRLS